MQMILPFIELLFGGEVDIKKRKKLKNVSDNLCCPFR